MKRFMQWLGMLLLMSGGAAAQEFDRFSNKWTEQPEAFFITGPERNEYRLARTEEERQAFRERYWLRRDPTPGTARNEFREMIEERIHLANQRFRIGSTPGSRTAQGFVFIVFGSPSRAGTTHGGPMQDTFRGLEGSESEVRWSYDRERTAALMDVLGVPKFDVTIIIDPTRDTDRIQNPGLVNKYRDLVAEKSVTNPDLVPPSEGSSIITLAPGGVAVTGDDPVSPLRHGYTVRNDGGARKYVTWFFVPDSVMKRRDALRAAAVVASGSTAVTYEGTVTTSSDFATPAAGGTYALQVPVPPEASHVRVVLFDAAGKPIGVSEHDVNAVGAFDVSPLVISGGPSGTPTSFNVGTVLVPPRADAEFRPNESLWYFAEVQGVPSGGVTIVQRLRRSDGKMIATPPFKAEIQTTGNGGGVVGYEVPLAQIEPGDYALYLELRPEGGEPVVRRVDFTVVP